MKQAVNEELVGEPVVNFTDEDHVIGIWFAALDGVVDVMATAWYPKDTPDVGKAVFRIRYYDPEDPGNDPFSGKDKKSIYSMGFSREDEQKMLDLIEGGIDISTKVYGELDVRDFIEVRDTGEVAFKKLLAQPWCHVKTIDMGGTKH